MLFVFFINDVGKFLSGVLFVLIVVIVFLCFRLVSVLEFIGVNFLNVLFFSVVYKLYLINLFIC